MVTAAASYRQILRSTTIVGGATIASLLFGLIRMKVLALIVGPAGVGLFAVLFTLFTTGSTIAGLNLQAGGVRQVGGTAPGSPERDRAEAGLWLLTFFMAVVGAAGFWIFERFFYLPAAAIAEYPAFPWLAIAVGLNTIAVSQIVLLQVDGRIGDIARVRIWAALLTTLVAVVAVLLAGTRGLYAAVLGTPLASVVVGMLYRRAKTWRVPRLGAWVWQEWRGLAGLSLGVTVAAVIGSAGQLLVRSLIDHQAGLSAVGLFQAAWTISYMNLSIVLTAMAMDYFPRLSAQSEDSQAMSALFNQQLHVAVILAGPMLAFVLAAAPILTTVLYSSSFAASAPVLQWQLAGDVWKLVAWALGFVLLARRATIAYIVAELVFDAVMLALLWLFLPRVGLEMSGIAYAVALFASTAFSTAVAARLGIRMNRRNLLWVGGLFAVMLTLIGLSKVDLVLSMIVGALATAALLWLGWREFKLLGWSLPGPLRRLATMLGRN